MNDNDNDTEADEPPAEGWWDPPIEEYTHCMICQEPLTGSQRYSGWCHNCQLDTIGVS